jgi:6-phosphogluconolactonase/glucosamine-6-phosphate isomerase/deaminase
MELPESVSKFQSGLTKVSVEKDAVAMGTKSALLVADAMKDSARSGRKSALWLMAAPSGFAFYEAFIGLCSRDKELAKATKEAAFFQFDDYPVPRGDKRFPITFRHLLETRFFAPLASVCGPLPGVRLLEIGTRADDKVAAEYAERLLRAAEDPDTCLIQLKGIGMDGHWGFHGDETPLDTPPAIVKVSMNKANIHQQKLDWPEFFADDKDVPTHAYTGDVELFLKADIIVDNVPQASKAYSVLATYGTDAVIPEVPSTALKRHPASYAFLTRDSASALLEFRALRAKDFSAVLSPDMLGKLEKLWDSGNSEARAENIARMREVLAILGMIGA